MYKRQGTDLIIEQIRVAMGEPLSFTQEEVTPRGHAIECRINAEIPEKNFMPSPGVVKHLHLPSGNGVRVDTGLYTGYRIPSEYDSMICLLYTSYLSFNYFDLQSIHNKKSFVKNIFLKSDFSPLPKPIDFPPKTLYTIFYGNYIVRECI